MNSDDTRAMLLLSWICAQCDQEMTTEKLNTDVRCTCGQTYRVAGSVLVTLQTPERPNWPPPLFDVPAHGLWMQTPTLLREEDL